MVFSLSRVLLLGAAAAVLLPASSVSAGQSGDSAHGSKLPTCPETVAGQTRTYLFPQRFGSSPTVPFVPQYSNGRCEGPYCIPTQVVDVTDRPQGNHFVATHPITNVTDPASISKGIHDQTRYIWTQVERELGALSIDWHTDIFSIEATMVPLSTPNGPNYQLQFLSNLALQTAHMTVPPVVSPLIYTPVAPADDLIEFAPRIFDSNAVNKITDAHLASGLRCSVSPLTAVNSPLCPVLPGFSNAVKFWNRYATSVITAINTNGTDITSQYNQIISCLSDLLNRQGVDFTTVVHYRIVLARFDLATENQFRALWQQSIKTTFKGWRATRRVEKAGLVDPNAILGIAIDYGYNLNPAEELTEADLPDGDVFYLANETALTVQSPAGWTFTTQLFGTTNGPTEPIAVAQDGESFPGVTDLLSPGLQYYVNLSYPDPAPGGIYAKWVAQHVQLWYNADTALSNVALSVTDSVHRLAAYSGLYNPFPFLAVSQADTIVFNGTEGSSGFQMPQRDELLCSEMPFFAGGQTGSAAIGATVFSMAVIALDVRNVLTRAPNEGNIPGAINWNTCEGTDLASCPKPTQVDLGAEAQPASFQPTNNP